MASRFFVISGFLITQHTLSREGHLSKINIRNFYLRRIARIVPCLVLLISMGYTIGKFRIATFSESGTHWYRGFLSPYCFCCIDLLDESFNYRIWLGQLCSRSAVVAFG